MANPLDVLNGGPAILTKGMMYAFKDALIEVEGVDGMVTLYDYLEYIGANVGEGGGGGSGDSVLNQVSLLETDEIEITINGGILPEDDEKILVIAPWGPVPPIALDADLGWEANREVEPNVIIFAVGAPPEPYYVSIQIAIPAT